MMADGPGFDDGSLTPAVRRRAVMREPDLLSREIEPSRSVAPSLAGDDRADDDLRRLAQGLLRQRATVSDILGSMEFVNPASNIMLFLYAGSTDAPSSAGDCCKAAGVPRTTALRWIGILEHKQFVTSTADPADGRRTFVTLTDLGRTTMRRCLVAIGNPPDSGLPAV